MCIQENEPMSASSTLIFFPFCGKLGISKWKRVLGIQHCSRDGLTEQRRSWALHDFFLCTFLYSEHTEYYGCCASMFTSSQFFPCTSQTILTCSQPRGCLAVGRVTHRKNKDWETGISQISYGHWQVSTASLLTMLLKPSKLSPCGF